MSALRFSKLSATGNDFILFDNRERRLKAELARFFQRLCERHIGIGADGVLLIELSERADFRMRYFNADGRESEMCGNGARATAYYAAHFGIAPSQMRFEVWGSDYTADVEGQRVRLTMRPPKDLRLGPGVVTDAALEEGGYVDTGVPHFVVFCADADKVEVERVGRKYRHHPAFQPRGTNVDFAQVLGPQTLRVRTYERGVEAETMACGTGVAAAAVIAERLGRLRLPATIHVPGGTLEIARHADSGAPVLVGEVLHVFDGELRGVAP